MRKRRGLLLTACAFLIVTGITLLFFRLQAASFITSGIQLLLLPTQRATHGAFGPGIDEKSAHAEVLRLREQLRKQKSLEGEVKALRDQFQSSEAVANTLLPAQVVGTKGFIPGLSQPHEIILDRGTEDGVVLGDIVEYKNNLVGKITKVSPHLSRVSLVSEVNNTLTGKTLETNALGVVSGEGNGVIVLKNVVLSEKLTISDLVVTKGDKDEEGRGYPPDIVIGKIVSVDKKPSALFQTAKVQSLLNIPKLSTVFIQMQQ